MTRKELLEHQREDCLKAIHEILRGGQSVTVEGMKLDRADLGKVSEMLNDIENELAVLTRQENRKPRSRVKVVVPL